MVHYESGVFVLLKRRIFMTLKSIRLFYLLCLFLSIALSACKDDNGNSMLPAFATLQSGETIEVEGSIDDSGPATSIVESYLPPAPLKAAVDLGTADTIMAVPITFPLDLFGCLAKAQTFPISDNKFKIKLDKSSRWVLMLLDSTQTLRKDQVLGFVGLNYSSGNGESANMVLLPIDKANGTINAGNLSLANGDEAVSSGSLEANLAQFDLDQAKLREIATYDTLLKGIKNVYVWDDGSDNPLRAFVQLSWSIDQSKIQGTFNDLNAATRDYDSSKVGYLQAVEAFYGSTIMTFEDIKPHTYDISMTPPSALNVGGTDYNFFTTKVTWNDVDCPSNRCSGGGSDGKGPITAQKMDNFGALFVFVGGTNNPSGWWTISKIQDSVSTPLTYMDLGYTYLDIDGKPGMYMPAIKATIVDDGEGNIVKISELSLKWYLYDTTANDGAGAFVEVTDVSEINNLCYYAPSAILMGSGAPEIAEFSRTTFTYTPTGEWRIKGGAGTYGTECTFIEVVYVVGGVMYTIMFN